MSMKSFTHELWVNTKKTREFINADEDGLHQDIGEMIADAHLNRQVMGREVVVTITGE